MPKKKRDERYHQPPNVSLPLFKPFTTVQLMVWFRSQCSGPVTVRVRGKYSVSWVTVFEVIMPEREDLEGVPLLRSMDAFKYCDLVQQKEQREALDNILRNMTFDQHTRFIESLQGQTYDM